MPVMSFDLEDGKPPVSFSINNEGAERFMDFMAECQAIRDSVKQSDSERDAALTTAQIDAIANTFNWHNARCCGVHYRFALAIIAAMAAQQGDKK